MSSLSHARSHALLVVLSTCLSLAGCQCMISPDRERLGPQAEGDASTDAQSDSEPDVSDDGDPGDGDPGDGDPGDGDPGDGDPGDGDPGDGDPGDGDPGDGCDPQPEQCNGVDDNCNDEVDETFNVGAECEVPGCTAQGVFECNEEGDAVCVPPEDLEERCDREDNDCDGETDEGFDVGASCEAGGCAGGTIQCTDAGDTDCVPAMMGDEVCDGADNDCDDEIDEDLGLGDACEIAGCGVPTMLACGEEGAVVCAPALSMVETCDASDEDCDGEVDEGFPIGDACTIHGCDGVQTCSGPLSTECVATDPGIETCNDADDDCDGIVDEDVPLTTCTESSCMGMQVCIDGVVSCDVARGDEACDGRDNDCDGSTDEGFDVGASCSVFSCSGTRVCDGPSETVCMPNSTSREVCDGADNDCDNNVDEDVPTAACNIGMCPGVEMCMAGSSECVVRPTGGPDQCDGIDNDCDMMVDEDVGPCSTPGCMMLDSAMCVGGALVCNGGPVVMPEPMVCDGMDTNCDGMLDGPTCREPGEDETCEYQQFFGRSYLVCEERSWPDAREACADMGYELARIESDAENAAIVSWLRPMHGNDKVWIGASDRDGDEEPEWLDGTVVISGGYSNFEDGERLGRNDCVRIQLDGGEWETKGCGSDRWVLCKHPTH